MPTHGHVKGPSPVACLRRMGLLNPHVVSHGEATARDAAVGYDIYVDGPYKTAGAATNAAASLNGVEDAQAGGLYDVSALLSAHLQAVVNRVAKCLKHTKGHGYLSF